MTSLAPLAPPAIPEDAIRLELDYWDGWLARHGGAEAREYRFRVDPRAPLQQAYKDWAKTPWGGRLEVLDVGAGALTSLGKVWLGRDVRLHPIDPLADRYAPLLEAHGVQPPVRTSYGRAEDILQRYGTDRFDLGHARNSIDHSQDPIDAIEQLVAVVRRGGLVVLMHATNEADKQGFGGFHQWNLDARGGHFVIRGFDGHTTDMTERLDPIAHVETALDPSGEWMTNVIHRR